jgi:hypothetical protein
MTRPSLHDITLTLLLAYVFVLALLAWEHQLMIGAV